jgi:hypothetical protein
LASLTTYDRSNRQYRLNWESCRTLINYVNFTPPTTLSRQLYELPGSRNFLDRPSSFPPPSYTSTNPTPGTFSGVYRPATLQPPSRTIQPATPPLPRTRSALEGGRQERHTPRFSRHNERAPLLPYAHPHTAPAPSGSGPSSFPFAKFMFLLFCLCFCGALGYGGYRLYLLGKLAWEWLRAKIL